MRKTSILLIIVLLVSLFALPMNTEAKTIAQFEAEVNKYTAELQEKKNNLAKNATEVAQIKSKISSIEKQITAATTEMERLQKEIVHPGGVQAEAGPVIKCHLKGKEPCQHPALQPPDQPCPHRHHQVKPQQNHHEIKLIASRAEKQAESHIKRTQHAEVPPQHRIVNKVKQRPHHIGNQHRPDAPPQKAPVVKGLRHIQVVKHAKGRNKEENRHAEPGCHLEKRHQMHIGSRVGQILGACMDAHHPQHGDAPDILYGRQPRLTDTQKNSSSHKITYNTYKKHIKL